MFNKKGESQMDKTVLVVEIIKLSDSNITYELFNRLGQFDVERIEKVEVAHVSK
jgi:hypothetical protein